MKSKKGQVEAPGVMIYTLFVINFLFLAGVLMVLDLAEDADASVDFLTENLEHDVLSHRLINSADCLAYEEQTPAGYQVRAGIIDMGKLNKGRLDRCLGNTPYAITITDLESQQTQAISSGSPELSITDYYFIKINQNTIQSNGVIKIEV